MIQKSHERFGEPQLRTSLNRSRIESLGREDGRVKKRRGEASNSKRQTIRLPGEGVGLRWRQIKSEKGGARWGTEIQNNVTKKRREIGQRHDSLCPQDGNTWMDFVQVGITTKLLSR